jgi:hypothetical protein
MCLLPWICKPLYEPFCEFLAECLGCGCGGREAMSGDGKGASGTGEDSYVYPHGGTVAPAEPTAASAHESTGTVHTG